MKLNKVVPKRQNNIVSRNNIDNTVAIMRLDEDQNFFTLDAIAAEAWNLIDGKSNVDTIVEKLEKKHKEHAKRINEDVHKLILKLKKEKLVELKV